MSREIAQLTHVEGGERIILSELTMADAETMAERLLQVQYDANHAQYVPHAMPPEDLDECFDYRNQQNVTRYQRYIEHCLAMPNGGTVIVVEELIAGSYAALAGFCYAYDTPPATYIQEIAVHPVNQKRGVGTLLLKTALDHLAPRDGVALDAMSCNPTVNWYTSMGFQDTTEGVVLPIQDEPYEHSRAFYMVRARAGLDELLSQRTDQSYVATTV